MDTPRNVWFYLDKMEIGGVERIVLNLMNGLKGRGWSPVLVLNHAQGDLLEAVPEGVPIIELDAWHYSDAVRKLAAKIRAERPPLILSQRAYLNGILVLAKMLSGQKTPLALAEHTLLSRWYADPKLEKCRTERLLRWVNPVFYRQASRIIGISRAVAEDLVKTNWLSPDKVSVLYNPAVFPNLTQMAEAPWSPPWKPDSLPLILAAGRLEYEKGFDYLVKAFAELLRHRDARLAILGEGSARGCIEATARILGIEDRVFLPGFQRNPYPWFRQAGVYALSSICESFPTVLIEAMALGTPVVSFDCPFGPREILTHGKDGLLVPLGDVQGLAQTMLDVLETPKLANTLRFHGYARAQDFTFDKTISAYETLFKEMLQ